MDGIHDLGGRQGFGGPLGVRDELHYHEPWELRVRAVASLMIGNGCWNTDAFRHAIERLDPVDYLTAGYFGRWLLAVEKLIAEADARPTPGLYPDATSAREIERAPRFAVGDAVRTRNLHSAGHTRLPAYARARCGSVTLQQGAWVLPDAHAHGRGERPEHVYSVRFEASELWGEDAEPASVVYLDCFESYLEPA